MRADMRKPTQTPVAATATTAFINARLIDPASGRDEPGGLVVTGDTITDIGSHLRRNAPGGATVVDCGGHVLCPGLVDMQVFTGEPGQEHRETLKTAGRAAAAGGVTTIVVMPDTNPVIDQVALVDFIQRRARDNVQVNVQVMAAMTRGLAGEDMTEFGLLQRAGAVAFSNGKNSITNTRTMRQCLMYAKDFGALLVHHTEDPHLSKGTAMNSGERATRLGLPGVHRLAETIVVERDIRLVEMTGGARYHAATITCAESLGAIQDAKRKGLTVTCGVSINHLTLNENDIGPYRTFLKVRPPLRAENDRVAMVRGIASGDIDVIVSSHDPQDVDVKRHPFAEAADGALGLETLLAAALRLYHADEIGLLPLLKAMTITPAKLLGLDVGRLDKGAPADLILVDLGQPWVVDKAQLKSRSKNSPFDESKMTGRVLQTMVAGEVVYRYGATS
jgi:dihydroorotase